MTEWTQKVYNTMKLEEAFGGKLCMVTEEGDATDNNLYHVYTEKSMHGGNA